MAIAVLVSPIPAMANKSSCEEKVRSIDKEINEAKRTGNTHKLNGLNNARKNAEKNCKSEKEMKEKEVRKTREEKEKKTREKMDQEKKDLKNTRIETDKDGVRLKR